MSHAETMKELLAREAEAHEAMQAFNAKLHDSFPHGYALGWDHNGHIQSGWVIGVLGSRTDSYRQCGIRVFNPRTQKDVDITFYQVKLAEEIKL